MTCPRCQIRFEAATGICPECGVSILRNVSGVMKTSTVLISAGDESGSYRSIQEVPERLRRQLLEITNSENAGTIVIADRAGKEQLTQVVARRDSSDTAAAGVSGNALGGMIEASAQPPSDLSRRRIAGLPWTVWAAILLILAAGIVIGFVLDFHW